jgi:hypothetical protein
VAAGVRATATKRVQAFHKAQKEGAVASRVTFRGNSERASGKQDLSQNITLAGVMGQIASGDQERTLEIEGLSLNDSTAPDVDGTLEQEVFEAKEPTIRLGTGNERALGSIHGSSGSEDWNSMIEVETKMEERAVTPYQSSSSSGADGGVDSKPVPHQVQGERAGPLGPTTLEGLQVFHESQWDKIRSAMDLDFWAMAEEHLVELEQASTRFLGQNQGRLSLDQER